MDMIQTFLIMKGIGDLEAIGFFAMNTREPRGHGMKIMKQTSMLNLRQFSFSHRVVDDWNCLPRKVVEARDVEHFKADLDEVWEDTLPYQPEIPRANDLNAAWRDSYVERCFASITFVPDPSRSCFLSCSLSLSSMSHAAPHVSILDIDLKACEGLIGCPWNVSFTHQLSVCRTGARQRGAISIGDRQVSVSRGLPI